MKYYRIPNEFYHRIHFVRPRFKGNIENVLLYMANECCKIDDCSCADYNQRYTNAIRMFPGNIGMANKTIQNWRTEIPALFAFYEEDKDCNITRTTKMAEFLNEEQDLTQFFKFFLYSFQFPGGHLKAKDNIDIIYNNIRFKPAKTIIQVLLAGNAIYAEREQIKDMSLSAEEATYCIFNDIRVTSGNVSPSQIAMTIINNREKGIRYYDKKDPNIISNTGAIRTKGDVTRYAGDILDYMVIASLLQENHGYFSLEVNQCDAIKAFADDTTFFNGYEKFYSMHTIKTQDVSAIEWGWFNYVNQAINPNLFKTDIVTLLSQDKTIDVVVEDRIFQILNSDTTTKKDVGNIGEALVCGHEKMRLKIAGYKDFIKLVQVVDGPSYHPGFDIDSFEGDGTNCHRYIEVKTTISKQKIQMFNFHMSPNEWSVAETNKEHYCVYRLMLSENEKILYILRNPVSLYKTDQIGATPRNGMEVSFNSANFKTTELLSWID